MRSVNCCGAVYGEGVSVHSSLPLVNSTIEEVKRMLLFRGRPPLGDAYIGRFLSSALVP